MPAIYRFLARAARRPLLATAAIAVLPILLRLALLPVLPHPEPSSHDEFAYLLGADLFAHGHLAAPTHRYWKFLESAHVLSQPVYAPKYPPGQAAFLALGQTLVHDPWVGVLLSVALFAAAFHWMLRALVHPAWALFGGVAAALYFGPGHYWTETYWGGAVAALGASLILGAFFRLRNNPQSPPLAAALGLGSLLLITTRPYESAALILIVTLALLRRPTVPVLAGFACAAAVALAYNSGVTGHALEMPYMVHRAQYSANPAFWFFSPYPDMPYANPALREVFQGFERTQFQEFQTRSWPANLFQNGLMMLATIFVDSGIFVLVPLFFIPFLWRSSGRLRFLVACAAVLTAALLVETFFFLHFMAPLIVILSAIAFLTLDRIWTYRSVPTRHRAVIAALILCAILYGPTTRIAHAAAGIRSPVYLGDGFGSRRAALVRQLLALPGNHLVFVQWHPGQNATRPWVANGADIDSQRIVWAHDRGPENLELIAYYPNRRLWTLSDSQGRIQLRPGPPATYRDN